MKVNVNFSSTVHQKRTSPLADPTEWGRRAVQKYFQMQKHTMHQQVLSFQRPKVGLGHIFFSSPPLDCSLKICVESSHMYMYHLEFGYFMLWIIKNYLLFSYNFMFSKRELHVLDSVYAVFSRSAGCRRFR